MITSHDLLYRAVITRGSAKLECFVGINANYPTEMPFSALELSWNGRHNAENNAAIKVCFLTSVVTLVRAVTTFQLSTGSGSMGEFNR